MRVVLDECVNACVRAAFPGFQVRTVTEIGWRSSKDGPLLTFAQISFDVFVTIDRKLEHQQNIRMLNLGIVVVHVASNQLDSYRPLFGALLQAVKTVKAGQVLRVESRP